MNSEFLFRKCLSELEQGRQVVRAVILKTWGSTPREVGADMVIDSSGELHGTVGGGCGEAEVYEAALDLLQCPEKPAGLLVHVDLTENPDDGGGKVCGGRFDVLLHRLSPDADRLATAEAVRAFESGEFAHWCTSLEAAQPGFWKLGAFQQDFQPGLVLERAEGTEPSLSGGQDGLVFQEPVGVARRLVIVGAGHIARPLCAMASLASYSVHILDDRAEYALEKFFPEADGVHCDAYERSLPNLVNHPLCSAVLVTRGHKHDQDCLRLILEQGLEYLGMIGSQRRIDAVYAELVEEGYSKEHLARVRAPIGLEIGAQTPAEIACCILAEMIMLRRKPGQRLPLARERHLRTLKA